MLHPPLRQRKRSSSKSPQKNTIDSSDTAHIQVPKLFTLANVVPTLVSDISLLSSKIKIAKDSRVSSEHRYNIEGMKRFVSSNILNNYDQFQDNSYPTAYDKSKFDSGRRLSLFSKLVGNRSEEIVIKFLMESLHQDELSSLRWTSKEGETPGWDIDYHNSKNELIAIEVKGTTGEFFPNIELTMNEWTAARDLKERYWIYIVSNCLSLTPCIEKLQNPFILEKEGLLSISPILWRLERI
jgi:hypothetical protein